MQTSPPVCAQCARQVPPGSAFCPTCGQAVSSPVMQAINRGPGASLLLKERYRVIELVGTGGFGAVFRAEDTVLGGRLVAVKEMNQAGLGQQELVEATVAFKREAMLLAHLSNPHLPHIYEYFSEAGRWYLVMEFIEGRTLEEYIQHTPGGALQVEDVLQVGVQVCEALEYLHGQQPPIIFRDLKPSNVMCTPEGRIVLIDFGIARHFRPGHVKDTLVLGSPGYAAPEQYGKAQTSPRSDIYSLGAVLHHLFTGIDPSMAPFCFAPLQPGASAAAEAFGRIVGQMTDIDAGKRPESASAVRQELARLLGRQAAVGEVGPVVLPSRSAPSPSPTPFASWSPGAITMIYRGHKGRISSLAWSPDGARVASGSYDKSVQVWQARSGECLLSNEEFAARVRAVAWSPDGTRLAFGGDRKRVPVWDALTGWFVCTYWDHSGVVYALAWSPDSLLVASGGSGGSTHVWNGRTGARSYLCAGHWDSITALGWSPDGRYLAVGGKDAVLQLVRAGSGAVYARWEGHSSAVTALSWAPDGKRVATAGRDRSIRIWELDNRQGRPPEEVLTYNGHAGAVHAVAWSPGGEFIASAGEDRSVRVWEAPSGSLLLQHAAHTDAVDALAWSPDGKLLASGGRDGVVLIAAIER